MSLRLGTGIGPLGSAGMVGLWNASSLIKSIQSGAASWSAAYTTTATISSVDVNNTYIACVGMTNGGVDDQGMFARPTLTNSTTITFTSNNNGPNGKTYYWFAIEYMPGVVKSIQQGSMNFSSTGTPTATISSVRVGKAFLVWQCYQAPSPLSGVASYNYIPGLTLTNATTVTGQIGALQDIQLYFAVVEVY